MTLLVFLHFAAAVSIFAARRFLGLRSRADRRGDPASTAPSARPRRADRQAHAVLSAQLLRGPLVVAVMPLAVATAWFGSQVPAVWRGEVIAERWTWVESLGLGFSFRLDGFALLMALVVCGIGTLVMTWSMAYFDQERSTDRMTRFAGGFTAFAGSMLGLVLADDVWTLFMFWEATSITSFLLIGLDHQAATARAAAQRALLITAAGGLALLGGLVLVTQAAGTSSLAALAQAPPGGTAVSVGLALVLVGAATKSAQVPFHIWLPGAMAAPTPVSAFLHSATMVKAGVILVGRFAPIFAEVSWWRPAVVLVGGTTMIVGGLGALRQHDAKLLLAHGTVSQLGLLMVAFGIGHPDVTAAAVALLLGHALFKAALFLTVGVVDHATGTRDIRRLTGVGRDLKFVAGLGAVAAASMAGLPPMLGFVTKEAVLETLLHAEEGWATVAVVAVALGSVLTVAYTARFWFGVFGGDRPLEGHEAATVHHRPGAVLVAPVALLAAATIAGGVAAERLGSELALVGASLDPDSHGHLVLWAGVKAPVVISAVIVAAGIGLHLLLTRRSGLPAPRVSGEQLFQTGFDSMLAGARRFTSLVQNGSLPAYVAVIWCVVVAGTAAAWAAGAGVGPIGTVWADSLLQAAVALLAAGLAVAVAPARRRFSAVLLLGAVGYSLAVVFLLMGAPDLALTQVLVETLSLIVFLLVLRQLPEGYSPPPAWAPRGVRLAIAIAVGLSVGGLALAAGTVRTDAPVAEEHLARSEPEAGGRNVVNVILVDFRGIDTLGEITVLAVAAAGVANLVRAARRDRDDDNDPLEGPAPGRDQADDIGAPSVIFDVVARGLFPLVLLVSLYVTFHGHNAPGGGFAGGLVAGAAFVMRFLAGGAPHLRRPTVPTSALVGAGLALATLTAIAPLAFGQDLLESSIHKLHPPLLGEVKLVTSTAFDIGVYLVVVGVVLSFLTHLGAPTRPRSKGAAEPETATSEVGP